MASTHRASHPDGPRLGAFLTLTVALLLFFGGLSRVGQLREIGVQLSAPREDRVQAVRRRLREERERAILVIGTGRSDPPAGEASAPEASVSARGVRFGSEAASPAPTEDAPAVPAVPPPAPDRTPRRPAVPASPEAPPAHPAPSAPPAHARYTVRANDTLYRIAARFYGEGELWPLIQQANPGLDPRRLRVGTPLRIPLRDAGGRRLVDGVQARAGGDALLP